MELNGLDWLLVVIGLFCVGRGIMRGAIAQIFGIAGVIAGFLLAAHFYQPLGQQLAQAFPKLSGTPVISFIALYFLTWFCAAIVGYWFSRVLHKTGLGFLDRIWGAAVGLGKGLILAVLLISALTFLLTPQNNLLTDSRLTPHVQGAAHYVVQVTPQSVQQLFEDKSNQLKEYWMNRGQAAPSTGRKQEPNHGRR